MNELTIWGRKQIKKGTKATKAKINKGNYIKLKLLHGNENH